jgi:hypothetical protein
LKKKEIPPQNIPAQLEETTMQTARAISKCCCVTLGVFLSLALLVPVSEAQFKVTDNFNRADGAPSLAWSTWGNGALISGNQLETFGQVDVAGGIARNLDVTFPLSFSFDFSTNTPSDGGWSIGFNAKSPAVAIANVTSEIQLFQNNGSTAVCAVFQTSGGPSFQCGNTSNGQRDFTAKAHVSGTLNSDFSAAITIKYNDGLSPAAVTLKVAAPVGAIKSPLGSVLFFGNVNMSNGPHFFDNFSLTLK